MESTLPDLTAHWEHQLQAMAERDQPYQPFMDTLVERVTELMTQAKTSPLPESLRHLPQVKRPAFKKKRRAKASRK